MHAKFLLPFFLLLSTPLFGNNLSIEQTTIVDATHIRFEVSWDNAWYIHENNFDAVWCFAKVKRKNSDTWQALLFRETQEQTSNHFSIETPPDGGGVMLHSQASGLLHDQITLELTTPLASGDYELQIFGIEMVWVAEGAFYLGDGIGSQNAFRKGVFSTDSLQVLPYKIASENQIEVGTADEDLFGSASDDWSPKAAIPASYPKGYAGFYCMKYEITQRQYADFLNNLSPTQRPERLAVSSDAVAGTPILTAQPNTFRNGLVMGKEEAIACNGNGNDIFNEADDGQDWACNWLNASDLLAYLDWAALRPMTELEFEKACRGTGESLAGEFSWGTAFAQDANTPTQTGTSREGVSETASNQAGLASFNSGRDIPQLQGALRAGFAANQAGNRLQAGASFYGILELSGNVWEACVTVTEEALQFEGTHGDGSLSSTGNADAWAFTAPENLLRVRGGAWNSFIYEVGSFRDLSVSARFFANLPTQARRNTTGGRGVRSGF